MGHYKIVLPSLFFIAKSVYTILHQNIDTGTKPFSTIFLRPLRILEKWKMREIHVFFMYFAYQILNQVKKTMGRSAELLDAIRNLMVALHLIKGFSSKVYIQMLVHVPAADVNARVMLAQFFLQIFYATFISFLLYAGS